VSFLTPPKGIKWGVEFLWAFKIRINCEKNIGLIDCDVQWEFIERENGRGRKYRKYIWGGPTKLTLI